MMAPYPLLFLFLLTLMMPLAASATPCADDLESLSFDRVLDEYAELAFSAEEVLPESGAAILIKNALIEKGAAISHLIPESEFPSTQQRLKQKLASLRQKNSQTHHDSAALEAQARADEDAFLNIRFGKEGQAVTDGPLTSIKLSPNRKTVMLLRALGPFKIKLSLLSLIEGREVMERNLPATVVESIYFGADGKFLHVEYKSPLRILNYIRIPLLNLRTMEVFDTTTGTSLIKRTRIDDDGSKRRVTYDVTSDGKKVLVAEQNKVKVIDLITGKKSKFDFKLSDFADPEFDASGENIVVRFGVISTVHEHTLKSINIQKMTLNWERTVSSYKFSTDRKFLFTLELSSDRQLKLFLKDPATGLNIRNFSERNLDLANANISEETNRIFIPVTADTDPRPNFNGKVFKSGGYLYRLENSAPPIPLDTGDDSITIATSSFFDADSKLATVGSDGKIYVWDVETGRRLQIHGLQEKYKFLGLDPAGGLIGVRNDGPTLADPKVWKRLTSGEVDPP